MNSAMRMAQVVRLYPGAARADIVFFDNGFRSPAVPILFGSVSTNTGSHDLPALSDFNSETPLGEAPDRGMIAIVGATNGGPVILGFLAPQFAQTLFNEPDRFVHRTGSDVYSTVDAAGNTELYHPSGTYIRIGQNPEHEDLSGKDANQAWSIRRNTDSAPHLRIRVANAGQAVVTLDVRPDGRVTLEAAQVEITAPEVVLNADQTTINGNVTVAGFVEAAGDVRGMGVSLGLHLHAGVQAGSDSTTPPLPS